MAKSGKGKKKDVKDMAKTQATSAKEKPAAKIQPAITNERIPEQVTKDTNNVKPVTNTSIDEQTAQTNNAGIADRIIHLARSGISIYTVIVALLMGFMLYLRAVPTHDSVFTNWPWIDGTNYVNVASDDGVFHMRLLFNTIAHFPTRILYDPFTHFPYGSPVHFGPLFELIPATVAIILGLGHPSTMLIQTVGAYFPAVLGALCIIPTYYIGKKLFGRGAGLIAAITLAFLPGTFFWRSVLGETDHHVAEVFFMACTVACMVYALYEAKKSNMSFEQFKNKDYKSIRAPLLFGALAGLFFAGYLLSWIGALILGLILIIYFTIQAVIDHLQGKSLDYLLIMVTLVFGIPALLVLPYSLQNLSFELAAYSITQPLVLIMGIIGVGIICLLSRTLNNNKAEKIFFPITLAGVAIIAALLVYLIAPALFGSVAWGLNVFHPSGGELTVGEVLPTYLDQSTGAVSAAPLWNNFYFASPVFAYISTPTWIPFISTIFPEIPVIFTFTGVALLVLLYRVITRTRPIELLFLVWNAIMLLALISQNRFEYYYAVNASLLMGYLAYEALHALDLDKLRKNLDSKVKNFDDFSKFVSRNLGSCISVALVVAIFVVLAVYPALPMSHNDQMAGDGAVLFQTANSGGLGVSYEWFESLSWMRANTPNPQGSPIQSSFDYLNGTYSEPANGAEFNYPSSAYGVMSWWDYGHQIEYISQRIPNANPFQAGIIEMNNTAGPSYFFTSQTEQAAYDNLNKLDSRYVVIDNAMATGKFYAITDWINDTSGWMDGGSLNLGATQGSITLGFDSGKFLNSTMYKLYYGDADGMSHFRLVHDSSGNYVISCGYVNLNTKVETQYLTRTISDYTNASALYEQAKTPVWVNKGVDLVWGARPPEKQVKVFEKVKGATITGSAPAGSQVNASVTLQSGDRQFTYTNTAIAQNGSYSITVPYPTEAMNGTGYSSDVMPISKYTITYGNTTKAVDVPESAVMNGNTVQVS